MTANDETVTRKKLDQFTKGLGGSRFSTLFDILTDHGLRPLAKSNTETLLFRFADRSGGVHDVIAFRREPKPVLSFPMSFWQSRAPVRDRLWADFSFAEREPVINSPGHSSKESVGQLLINKDTFERLQTLCRDLCALVDEELA